MNGYVKNERVNCKKETRKNNTRARETSALVAYEDWQANFRLVFSYIYISFFYPFVAQTGCWCVNKLQRILSPLSLSLSILKVDTMLTVYPLVWREYRYIHVFERTLAYYTPPIRWVYCRKRAQKLFHVIIILRCVEQHEKLISMKVKIQL